MDECGEQRAVGPVQARLGAGAAEYGDLVAQGVLGALDRIEATVPIVVRLDGTNAEEGRAILAEAAPANLKVEPTMLEAAHAVVEAARG